MPGRLAVLPLLLVLFLAACDNPTGVGSDLVDEGRQRPEDILLFPSGMEANSDPDVTGFSYTTAASTVNYRMLSGLTVDPELGSIRADGYVDFFPSAYELTSDFAGGTVSSVTLVLRRTYVYGDTTASITLRLHDLADEWVAAGRRADTTVTTAGAIADVSVPVTGAYAEIPLPQSWVDRWDALIRSTSFSDDFHGFKLEALAGDAVVGFSLAGSSLRAVAGGDTTFFLATRMLSGIQFDASISGSDNRILLQDGRGTGVIIPFDFDDPRLTTSALSRARIDIPVDTSLVVATKPGYLRPGVFVVELDAVAVDPPERVNVDIAVVDQDGVLRFDSDDLQAVIRRAVEGSSPLDHFELRVDPTRYTLDVLLLPVPTGDEAGPRATLTVIPFE